MAMEARLTLSALYRNRSDLFDLLQIPSPPVNPEAIGLVAGQLRAAWTIDRADLADYICLQTMSMSVAYPDPDFLKAAIGAWSKAHIHEWQRYFDTLFFKYNPLWNKDGEVTESGWDHSSGEADSHGFTHGYDFQAPAANSANSESSESSDPEQPSVTASTASTDDDVTWTPASKNDGSSEANSSYSHTTTERGNIGVTMSQELIERERSLALSSFEDMIVNEFKKQFCLMIW